MKAKRMVRMLGIYDEYDESKEISEEDYKKLWGKKEGVKKTVWNPIKRIIGKKEGQSENEGITEEESQEMDSSEKEVEHQRLVEYSERAQPTPENEEENIAKLFEVSARFSSDKELVEVMHPQLKVPRTVAIESADKYPEIFIDDIPKGELMDNEIRCCAGNMMLINAFRTFGKAYKFPFYQISQFNDAQKNTMINLSRGRNGFSVRMSRLKRTETEGMIQHLKLSEAVKQKNKFKILR